MENILSTSNITKVYGKFKAVNNISINIKPGDIYGLVGRNGAGKTTLMKMITGLAAPTCGTYKIFDKSPKEDKSLLMKVGCLIESPGIYPDMTAYENVKQKAILLGIKEKGYVQGLLNLVGLGNVGKKKVNKFSFGMKQRLGIALALVGEPDLLILDEPINGLDPQGIVQVRDTILRLNKEKNMTILISSHILEELSKICTRFGFMNRGMLVEEDTVEELYDKCRDYIEINTKEIDKACTVLDQMNLSNYKVINNTTIRIFERIEGAGEINTQLVKSGITVNEIYLGGASLEEYFLNITGGTEQ